MNVMIGHGPLHCGMYQRLMVDTFIIGCALEFATHEQHAAVFGRITNRDKYSFTGRSHPNHLLQMVDCLCVGFGDLFEFHRAVLYEQGPKGGHFCGLPLLFLSTL